MIVRHVKPDDTEAWLRFRRALWPEESDAIHAQEIAAYFGRVSHRAEAVLMAEGRDQALLGFAEVSIRSYAEGCRTDRVAYLEGWYVAPEARRKGVGRALVTAAEEWGRFHGCTEFGSDALLDNQVSNAAHLALGFSEVVQIRCFRKDLQSPGTR